MNVVFLTLIAGSFNYEIDEWENASDDDISEATCQIILITFNVEIDFNVDHFYLIAEKDLNVKEEMFIGNPGFEIPTTNALFNLNKWEGNEINEILNL